MSTQSMPHGMRRLKYMFGAVTQIELRNLLDVQSIDKRDRKNEIKRDWSRAVEHFDQLRREEAGLPDSISSRPLSSQFAQRAEELGADPAFSTTFSGYPFSFEEVEIDKLIASQRTVHVEYIPRLASRYEQMGHDLFEFCLAATQEVSPVSIGRTAQNAFTASSENPGLRFLGAFEEPFRTAMLQVDTPGGQAIRVVVLVLGYGISTANVYRVGKRMILNNGFHRLYTLRSLGVAYAPVVVQQITHPEVELPPVITELPREFLIENPRPGLMKDFFEEQLTCEVMQRGFIKAVQVGWGINESMVPR